MTEVIQPIPARLKNVAVNGHVAGADDIIDDILGKDQATINSEVTTALGTGGTVDQKIAAALEDVAFIDDSSSSSAVVPSFDPESQTVHITAQTLSEQQKAQVRENIGLGDVDARISEAVASEASQRSSADSALQSSINAKANQATTLSGYGITDAYTKSETYTKTEVNGLITTPNQEYVSVTATAQTTAATDVLPATGEADTVYRVGNWDGSQYSEADYTEYAWNGSAYTKLSTKSQIGEVYDISANHADTKYADLAAALGTNGANIPESLRKGGMSVKFVQSSDNNYVQYRLMSDTFNTTVANWQGVDDEPTAGSDNLVKSRGVAKNLINQYEGVVDTQSSHLWRFPFRIVSGVKYRYRKVSGDGTQLGITDAIAVPLTEDWAEFTATSNYYRPYVYVDSRVNVPVILVTIADTGTSEENRKLYNELNGKVGFSDIANSLNIEIEGKVLDARQGKVLDDKIIPINNAFDTDGVAYETIKTIGVESIINKYIDDSGTKHNGNQNVCGFDITDFEGATRLRISTYVGLKGYPAVGVYENGTFNLEDSISTGLVWPRELRTYDFDIPINATEIFVNLFTDQGVRDGAQVVFQKAVDRKVIKGDRLPAKEVVTIKCHRETGIDTATDFYGLQAITKAFNSITDASEYKRYRVIIDGKFVFTNPSDVTMFDGLEYSVIYGKDYVDVEGLDWNNSMIAVIFNEQTTFPSGKTKDDYQPIRWDCNGKLSNLSIIGKYCRYAIHFEAIGRTKDKSLCIENCYIESDSNVFGTGVDDGVTWHIRNCTIVNTADNGYSFGIHSTMIPINRQVNIIVENCQLVGSVILDEYYAEKNINISFINCNFDKDTKLYYRALGNIYNTKADESCFKLIYGNPCIQFYNSKSNAGLALRFDGLSNGDKIRFDTTSSAFTLVIGNLQDTVLFLNTRMNYNQYGYEYRDGGSDTIGYAFGSIDVDTKNSNSIGKKLGDCSSTNKSLGIYLNDTLQTVTFDKDYTNMSNADILAEINAQLSGIVASVYSSTCEYYPQMEGLMYVANTENTKIESGMGVVFTSQGMRKAKNSDGYVDGICLDTVANGQKARVITKGSIIGYSTTQRYVLKSTASANIPFGSNLGISSENDGVFVVGATPSVAKVKYASNIVVIN